MVDMENNAKRYPFVFQLKEHELDGELNHSFEMPNNDAKS